MVMDRDSKDISMLLKMVKKFGTKTLMELLFMIIELKVRFQKKLRKNLEKRVGIQIIHRDKIKKGKIARIIKKSQRKQ